MSPLPRNLHSEARAANRAYLRRARIEPGRQFIPGAHLDMLSFMRTMMRTTTASLVIFVGVFALAFTTYTPPAWVNMTWPLALAGAAVTSNTSARRAFVAATLASVRPRWAERWHEAGVSTLGLTQVVRAPFTTAEFTAYAEALTDDATVDIGDGLDPRFVCWCTVNRLTPDLLRSYRAAGVVAADAPLLHLLRITPEQWKLIGPHLDAFRHPPPTEATKTQNPNPILPAVAMFASWVANGPASVALDDLGNAARRVPRSIDAVAALTLDWLRVVEAHHRGSRGVGFEVGRACPRFLAGSGTPCEVCGVPDGSGPNPRRFPCVPIRGFLISEWAETFGAVAPYIIEAGVSFDDARAMVAAGTPPTREGLAMLTALAKPAPEH